MKFLCWFGLHRYVTVNVRSYRYDGPMELIPALYCTRCGRWK
jgi:hypothetical protein